MESLFTFKRPTLESRQFRISIENAVKSVFGPDTEIKVTHYQESGGYSTSVSATLDSLDALQHISDTTFFVVTIVKGSIETAIPEYLRCQGMRGVMRLSAQGDLAVQSLNMLSSSLYLEPCEMPKNILANGLRELTDRVVILEKSVAARKSLVRCFITFKFDDASVALQVQRLKRFLHGIGVDWVSGEEFEPRRIEDKVKARLRADVNCILTVISKSGQSMWLRDEIADANARDIRILVLVEDGGTFDKGIFGTLEYIKYEHSIDETFLSVLEGMNFIRAELSAPAESNAPL